MDKFGQGAPAKLSSSCSSRSCADQRSGTGSGPVGDGGNLNSSPDHQPTIPGHLLGDAEEVPAGVTDWAAWAWRVLVSAGDVSAEIDDHADASPARLVTLAGLCHVYDLFEHIAAGHTSRLTAGPHLDSAETVGADDDELHGLDNSHRPDAVDMLLHEVIETRAEQLRARLCAVLGVAQFYAALRAAHMGDAMPDRPVAKVRISPDGLDDFYAACQSPWPAGAHSADQERVLLWIEGSLHLS